VSGGGRGPGWREKQTEGGEVAVSGLGITRIVVVVVAVLVAAAISTPLAIVAQERGGGGGDRGGGDGPALPSPAAGTARVTPMDLAVVMVLFSDSDMPWATWATQFLRVVVDATRRGVKLTRADAVRFNEPVDELQEWLLTRGVRPRDGRIHVVLYSPRDEAPSPEAKFGATNTPFKYRLLDYEPVKLTTYPDCDPELCPMSLGGGSSSSSGGSGASGGGSGGGAAGGGAGGSGGGGGGSGGGSGGSGGGSGGSGGGGGGRLASPGGPGRGAPEHIAVILVRPPSGLSESGIRQVVMEALRISAGQLMSGARVLAVRLGPPAR
jgi:hypothetical protein